MVLNEEGRSWAAARQREVASRKEAWPQWEASLKEEPFQAEASREAAGSCEVQFWKEAGQLQEVVQRTPVGAWP